MTETTNRKRHLQRIADQKIARTARDRRRRALESISYYSIIVTADGNVTREISANAPPTLSELAELAGGDAYVVSVGVRRRPRTRRTVLRLVSE
ncbi:hypothetical protein ACFMPD_15605 [Sedimentitalea sp. HM32M-2]|uniref:hypothetical protein n=1 Tax=Sedimentitalea sp. HM32M-2 TaxID=3351566 RepID=UPI00362BD562